MGRRWVWERKRDYYYRKAKREGYRSRAAYKLKQINSRFHVLRPGNTVIDLGCSPGGWSQVALEIVGDGGCVIGVDIAPARPIEDERFTFIHGDIRDKGVWDKIMDVLEGCGRNCADAVISDMAPNISGHYTMDQARSVELAGYALGLGSRFLCTRGCLVTKVFQGVDFPSFLGDVKSLFSSVKVHSPRASRRQSSEVYVIAWGYRGERTGELDG